MKGITRIAYISLIIGMHIFSRGTETMAQQVRDHRDHHGTRERVTAKRGSNSNPAASSTKEISADTQQTHRDAVERCFALVQEAINREQIRDLGRLQQEVNAICRTGDSIKATRLIHSFAAYQRCTLELERYIKRNGLVVTDEVRNRAVGHCRGGDIRKAIEIVAGPRDKNPSAAPEIISFSASRINVQKSQYVTFTWQTVNTEQVILGRTDSQDRGAVVDRRLVAPSGSQILWPDRTTTYVLLAMNRATAQWESKRIDIQVQTNAGER